MIDALIVKNVLTITDLPDHAQANLSARKSCFERVSQGSSHRVQPTDFGNIL